MVKQHACHAAQTSGLWSIDKAMSFCVACSAIVRCTCHQPSAFTTQPFSACMSCPYFPHTAGSPGSSPNQQQPYSTSHYQPIKAAAVGSAPTSPYRQRNGPAMSPQRPAAAAAASGDGGGISTHLSAVRFAGNSSSAGGTPSRGGTAGGVAAAAAASAAAAGRAAAAAGVAGGASGTASPRIDGKEFFRQAR
jgi:hypothetical protein